MSVVILLTGRCWSSVNATELNDTLSADCCINGPTYISRDQVSIPPDETSLYNFINARQVKDRLWSTNSSPAIVISKFYSYGYKLISQAGSGVGFSGKARYSADVAVSDFRWSWTLIRDLFPPPPYTRPLMDLHAKNTI